METESSVRKRYAEAAQRVEPALCCPVTYDAESLRAIPAEVLERDYGCGDPTPHVRPGDTVLDLGSGGGKLCFIASQAVGRSGRVIGIDCNREMLGLARWAAPQVAEQVGYANVEFRFGLIQDLQLDLERLESHLRDRAVADAAGYLELRDLEQRLRQEQPLVAGESVDCVLSNCVLNLVRRTDRRALFAEIFRVLKPGGRAAISDIVSDESVPEALQNDPELWSGCVSGAFREDEFLEAFEAAGFHGIEIAQRTAEPWQTIRGIEFRSLTVVAYKGKQGDCWERNQAVVYRGPFRQVTDDDGHTFRRGRRTAVCDKTFGLLMRPPYQGKFEPIEPRIEVPPEAALPFPCDGAGNRISDPRVTKGFDYEATTAPADSGCDPSAPCC